MNATHQSHASFEAIAAAIRDTAGPLPNRGTNFRRALELCFLLTGIACLSFCGFVLIQSWVFQAYGRHSLASVNERAPLVSIASLFLLWHHASPGSLLPVGNEPMVGETRAFVPTGSLIGSLEISRVGVDAVILEGADDPTLRVALGHVPGTAMPGETGNIAIAGHRDTFLRGLRRLQDNDLITLRTPDGLYQYRVESMTVVTPADTRVLASTSQPTLTLITCYPFDFIGPSPKRFIVRARRVAGASAGQ